MSGTDVSLTDLLLQAMQQAVESQNGPMLGQVNTYDPATRRANVTPLVPLYVEPGDEPLPPPAIPHVLVVWPEGPSHAITWPLGAGATVILEPLGHDHTAWITSGTANQPSRTRRRFALADVVAVPLAARPNTNPPPATSYDPAWAVLFGQWAAGGSDATKAVALDGDAVNKYVSTPPGSGFAAWMASVEAIASAGTGGTVTPPAANITQIGTVVASAQNLKAK